MTVALPHRAILGPEEIAMLARAPMPKIHVNEAAQITGLHPAILTQLVSFGVLSGDYKQSDTTCDVDQAVSIADQLKAAKLAVEGTPILVSEAAQKYGFDRDSIYNWIKRGWVSVLQEEPRKRVNEGDIAFAYALASKQGGHIEGRAVFPAKPRSGRPRKQR